MEKEAVIRYLNKKIMKEKTVLEPVVDPYDRASFLRAISRDIFRH